MFVTDRHHLLDLPADIPGPVRRLVEHLASIVLAATVGWGRNRLETALWCRR